MSKQKGLLQADQDLGDIRALKRVPGFERYLLRRLAEKRDGFAEMVLNEDVPPERREMLRQLYLEYKWLCGMFDLDEANAMKLLAKGG
jgi:hypothetical protein